MLMLAIAGNLISIAIIVAIIVIILAIIAAFCSGPGKALFLTR